MSAIGIEITNNMFRAASKASNKTSTSVSGNEIDLIPAEYHWVIIPVFSLIVMALYYKTHVVGFD